MRKKRYQPFKSIAKAQAERHRRSPLTKEEVTDIAIAGHYAVARMAQGDGTAADWWSVKSALDIALELAKRGYGEHLQGEITEGTASLRRAATRPNFGFDGSGLQSVNNAMAIYDAQLEAATRKDLIVALNQVRQERNARPIQD